MSTWLITGCSSGLGRHLAEAVLEAGHNAVVTARDVSTVEDLVRDHPETALTLPLDVTDGRPDRRRGGAGRGALRSCRRARE